MNIDLDQSNPTVPSVAVPPLSTMETEEAPQPYPSCRHCGAPCHPEPVRERGHAYCCHGCSIVHQLLTDHGLAEFYELAPNAAFRVENPTPEKQFQFLDAPNVRAQLVDFEDEHLVRLTFRIPSIHCIACVWVLENLFRFHPGIGPSEVNFPRKELALRLNPRKIKISETVALLAALGYEPELQLAALDARPAKPSRHLWIQLGVAGFAFGNIMLFSLPAYLGLDQFSGPAFQKIFGILNLLLGTLVVGISARDYWQSAWQSFRQRLLNIDVPITLGVAALYGQSAFEVLSSTGEGYFDSLAGLLFFLLIGKAFQKKSYDQLAFDRDYKAFFPLAVTRRNAQNDEERVTLADLQVGDTLVLRNGDLVPADARLVDHQAVLDYSFVTGESRPVTKSHGDQLYAGGRLLGGCVKAEILKPVSQSYLTSLWNQDAFAKDKAPALKTLTNRYSQYFTAVIIGIALLTALAWAFYEPARAVTAFTAVLIVACPCALALAAPFALGTAHRVLARHGVFLKSQEILESLARIDTIVFDKTGTLTELSAAEVTFQGATLTPQDEALIHSLSRHSGHTLAVRIEDALADSPKLPVSQFEEVPGAGMQGAVDKHIVRVGSVAWLHAAGVVVPENPSLPGLVAHVAIDGAYKGAFVVPNQLRTSVADLLKRLHQRFHLALLSGDRQSEMARFQPLFNTPGSLHFEQSPRQKLEFVRHRQKAGHSIMMVGDGLNDAGALQQSQVGVAIVENLGAFSPASDVILSASALPLLDHVLHYARQAVRVVRASLAISAAYNVAGIAIASTGLLSPVICAILMSLSSISVVAVAVGFTSYQGKRLSQSTRTPASQPSLSPAPAANRSFDFAGSSLSPNTPSLS